MKRILIVATMTACTSPGESFLLDHPQILAVRAEPSHVAPGGTVRVDTLVATSAGEIAVVAPEAIDAGDLPAEARADGWYVTGRAGLASITVVARVEGVELVAQKELVFADQADNPTIAAMQLDGNAIGAIDVVLGTKPALGVASTGVEPLSFAWYTSIGSLEHFRRADATFDADEAGDGRVCVVVRDPQGGVTWQMLTARVQ